MKSILLCLDGSVYARSVDRNWEADIGIPEGQRGAMSSPWWLPRCRVSIREASHAG